MSKKKNNHTNNVLSQSDKLRLLRKKYNEYKEIKNQIYIKNESDDIFMQKIVQNDDVYKICMEGHNIIIKIDPKKICLDKLPEFYFMAWDFEFHIGNYLLRTSQKFIEDRQEICTDELIMNWITDGIKRSLDMEKIIDKNKIVEAIYYFESSLKFANNLDLSKQNEHKCYCIHRLVECYSILEENNKCIEYLEKGIELDDLRSFYEVIYYYSEKDVFYFEKFAELFEKLKNSASLILEKQKKAGVGNFADDFDFLDLPAMNEFEQKEIFILFSMKLMALIMMNHSNYDKAIEISLFMKNELKEYVFWNKRYENETLEFYNEVVAKAKVNKEEIEPSDEFFKNLKIFKESTINKLNKDIKIYVATSLVIFNDIQNIREFTADYSPAVIPLFKALENILYIMTINGFFKYISINRNKYYKLYESNSIYDWKNDTFHLPEHFDMGTGLNILAHWKFDGNKKVLDTFNTGVIDYFKSHNIFNVEDKLREFCENVEKCRLYRNMTAHRDRVNRTVAEDAKNIILDTVKIIEKAYDNFSDILVF